MILLLLAVLLYIVKNRLHEKINYTDLVIYLLIIGLFAGVALRTENADLTCPDGPYTKNKNVCKHGNGKLVQVANYKVKDNICDITKKMNMLIKNKHTQVYWRRSFILAVIVGLFINYLTVGSFPNGRTFLITVLFVYMASSSLNSFYVHHNDKVFDDKIVQGLVRINKLNSS